MPPKAFKFIQIESLKCFFLCYFQTVISQTIEKIAAKFSFSIFPKSSLTYFRNFANFVIKERKENPHSAKVGNQLASGGLNELFEMFYIVTQLYQSITTYFLQCSIISLLFTYSRAV